MSQHARYEQWMSRGLDRELTDVEHRELRHHLQDCPSCRTLSDQLTGLRRLLREDAGTTASVGLGARIWSRVESERRTAAAAHLRPAVRQGRMTMLRRSAALAAGLLLCLGTFYVARLPGEALAENPAPAGRSPALDQRVLEILDQRPERPDEAEGPSLLELLLVEEGG